MRGSEGIWKELKVREKKTLKGGGMGRSWREGKKGRGNVIIVQLN